jgi:hypothetical protein
VLAGFQPQQLLPTGDSARSVAIGDLNGDGKPDLATANQGDATASVILGNGNGTFQPKQDRLSGRLPSG